MRPKIGIVICGFSGSRQFISNPYIQSVRYSRGIPLIIPIVRSDYLLNEYIGLCDGFLFCGGDDITPLLFGEEPKPGNGHTDITADLFHIRLMKQVLSSGKPVFGICRGMQILNIACGGTIWQDLSLIPGKTLDHMQHSAYRSEVSHRITTVRESSLRKYIGCTLPVNSYHHQAVNQPGKGLMESARSGDGVTEALEMKGHRFAVGVQWHPECMFRSSPEMRRLFQEFVLQSALASRGIKSGP